MSRQKQGFTLIELMLILVLGIIVISLAFGYFSNYYRFNRESNWQKTCQTNLKQIGLGLLMYAQDYDARLPVKDPFGAIDTYLGCHRDKITRCPKARESYGYYKSRLGLGLNDTDEFSGAIPLAADSIEQAGGALINRNNDDSAPEPRHFDTYNLVFADGHVNLRFRGIDRDLSPFEIIERASKAAK